MLFSRFARDAAFFVGCHRTQRAHIVQAVCKFDQDHAYIARHRQQHLAEVFGLGFGLTLEFDFFQFR